MNSNTITGYIGGTLRNQIASQTLAAVTETSIKVNTDTGSQTALIAVPSSSGIIGSMTPFGTNTNPSLIASAGGGQALNSALAGNQAPYFSPVAFDNGRPFILKLIGIGSAAANAGNTLTVKIYQGTSTTIGSDTLFATPMSAVATATAANLRLYLTLTCFWDSTSQVLSGVYGGNYTYNGTTTAIANTAVTSLTSITSTSALSFAASITWGNAVGGVIALSEFSLEQV